LKRLTRHAATALLVTSSASCLPGDDRPEPGNLLVTAVASPTITEGFTTLDGWAIRYDRFVTALGDIRLRDHPENSDSCNDYEETHYEWLFDFTVVTSPQKVGLTFGLGRCNVEFRFRGPSDDTVLGLGATESALAFMLVEGKDAYTEEDDERITLIAAGRAERDGVTKRFEWRFRHSYEYEECTDEADNPVNVVELSAGEAHVRLLEVHGEELFRMAPASDAPLLFDPLAAADADDDGAIGFDELAAVSLDPLVLAHPAWDETDPDELPVTLADLVYLHLLPRIVRMAGSTACEAELRQRW
jgi:hypothetical protein